MSTVPEKTVEEVNSELLLRTEAPNIVIVDREGTEYTISLAEADYQADYSNVLEHYRQEQNPFLWVDNVLFHSRRELSPTVTMDVDALRRAYDSLEFVRAEQHKNKDLQPCPGYVGRVRLHGWTCGTH